MSFNDYTNPKFKYVSLDQNKVSEQY